MAFDLTGSSLLWLFLEREPEIQFFETMNKKGKLTWTVHVRMKPSLNYWLTLQHKIWWPSEIKREKARVWRMNENSCSLPRHAWYKVILFQFTQWLDDWALKVPCLLWWTQYSCSEKFDIVIDCVLFLIVQSLFFLCDHHHQIYC